MWKEFLAHPYTGIADDQLQNRIPVKTSSFFNQKAYASAFRGELDRIAEDVDHHLLELHDIADIIIVYLPDRLAVVNNSFRMALIADHRINLFQRFGKRELFLLNGHPPGFDAAHIQNVIDNPQQMLGGSSDFGQVFLYLIAGCRIVHGDVIQADNRVHGCADLVAHVGKERSFCPVCALCHSQSIFHGFPAFRQLLFLFLVSF